MDFSWNKKSRRTPWASCAIVGLRPASELHAHADREGTARLVAGEGRVRELEVGAAHRVGRVHHVEGQGRQAIAVEQLLQVELRGEVQLFKVVAVQGGGGDA